MICFKTIRELVDYIPNCLICGKSMNYFINGQISDNLPIHIRMDIKDNILRSKNKKYQLIIDIDSNKIIDGYELVNRMVNHWFHFIKGCSTCDFKIFTFYNKGSIKKQEYFPIITLTYEELSFTMKHGYRVLIGKSYGPENTLIIVNGKYLPTLPLDLSKIKNLKQLSNKINTIILFQ